MNEIFYCVLNMSVDASYLIGAVILIRFLLRKSSVIFSKLLWLLVGLRLVVPFSFQSVFSLVPQRESGVLDGVVSSTGSPTIMAADVAETTLGFGDVVPFVWLGIVIIFAVFGLISFIKLKIKISDAVLLKDRVYQSENVDSPFVCGFVKPKIYVPYKIDEDVLECVLKHENTHLKCFDHILKLIGFVILCVHWFNPLVWLSYSLFCKDIELFCDELVVKSMSEEDRKKYARALCDIGVEKFNFSACPIAFGEVGIKERIKYVVNYKKVRLFAVFVSVILCVVVIVCFMTTPAKAQTEAPKIDFTETEENTRDSEITIPVTEVVEVTEVVAESETEPETESETELIIQQVTVATDESDNDNDYDEKVVSTQTNDSVIDENIKFNLAASSDYSGEYEWKEEYVYSVKSFNSTNDDIV